MEYTSEDFFCIHHKRFRDTLPIKKAFATLDKTPFIQAFKACLTSMLKRFPESVPGTTFGMINITMDRD